MIETIISSIVNAVLIIALLVYQIVKNRSLHDQIANQQRILIQTNEIVNKQSAAIDNQEKVVDTALKYTNAFSIERIEELVKREIEIEKRTEIEKIETKYKEIIDSTEKTAAQIAYEKRMLEKRITSDFNNYIGPFIVMIIAHLAKLSNDDRNSFLETFPNTKAKTLINELLGVLNGVGKK
jgi:hypothetical protein